MEEMVEQDMGRDTPDWHLFFCFFRQVRDAKKKKLLQISSNMKLENNIWSPSNQGWVAGGRWGLGVEEGGWPSLGTGLSLSAPNSLLP